MSNRYYWLTHPSSAQRLVTIDAATGAVLANIPIPLTFSSQMRMITLRINATGQLMAMASDGSVTKVARIDPANGAVAVLESLEGTVSAPLSHALYNAIDQIANRLYYVVYDPSTTGNVIYTMNATTGAILDVAPLAVGWAWPAHLEVIF